MGTSRITKEVLYLRHEFSSDERLDMGTKLAEAYNRLAEIADEETAMKAQIKDSKSKTEATIGSLSRNLNSGFTMVNVDCEPQWDVPNVGEVTLFRKDTGAIAKIRVMTDTERQMDLPLAGDVVVVAPEVSAANITEFFGVHETEDGGEAVEDEQLEAQDEFAPEPEDVFSDPDPAASKEAVKAENDSSFGVDLNKPKAKPGRKPRGFDGPTNQSAMSEF